MPEEVMLHEAMDFADVEGTSARSTDHNGFIIIRRNPILRAGVFKYKGSQLPGGDPSKVYNVLRPIEQLQDRACMDSLVGLPIIDEHEMLGGKYARSPEQKGVHGATLQSVDLEGNDLVNDLRLFSRSMKSLIDSGKKGLSLGYNCRFEKSAGEHNGIAYHYVQKDIRGNHLALVQQGRNGTDVLDHNDLPDQTDQALDTGEHTMADENKGEGNDDTMDLAKVSAYMKKHAPMWQELQKLMGGDQAKVSEALDASDGKKSEEKKDDKKSEKDEEEGKKEAMDANDVGKLLDLRLAGERKTLAKTIMSDVAARDALARQLTPEIGTFAFDSMDVGEVAAYGAEKLGLTVDAADAPAAVKAYLSGLSKGKENNITYAMDSAGSAPKSGGKLAGRLAQKPA